MSLRILLSLAVLVLLGASPAWARGKVPAGASPKPASSREDPARRYFTDLPLVTHEGQEVRFYSDVLKDRVVLITFFYTQCQGMCPIVNGKLSKVQDLLGERLGTDIFLISISVDPETDTPEVIRDYRKNFKAKDGWIFLTGNKQNIDKISRKLGQVYPKETHLPLLMLGNVKRARWTKLRPNVPDGAIAERLRQLASETSKR